MVELMMRCVDQPVPKEEGRRKSYIQEIGSRPSDRGGRQESMFNNRVDLQLQIMKRLG